MPQPVDLQTEVARVTAAERIQQIADRASLAAQHRLTTDTETDRIADEQQVRETLHTESGQVDPEARRRNPLLGRRRRKRNREEDPEEEPRPPVADEGGQLDIRV